MYNEHRRNKHCLLLIVDVHSRALRACCAFRSRLVRLGDWDVHGSLHRLILIIRVLHLEVKFDELFRVFWATLHGLHIPAISGCGISSCMEDARCLFGEAAEALECRL